MTKPSAVVLRGDAARLPLPDASVDLIVTSPPYFGLRSYTDGGEHYDGQVGSEATPREYLEALWACTAEWARVLKPEGSLFVNLGDKYAAGHGGSSTMRNGGYGANLTKAVWEESEHDGSGSGYGAGHQATSPRVVIPGTRPKSLLGMPWRYALGCIDDLGLILRAEIVWAKPNGLPESVADRVRRSHEQIFHFTRSPRYFSAVDEVREAHAYPNDPRWKRQAGGSYAKPMSGHINSGLNPLGKLPGSVWEIPSQPLTVPASLGVDHFAAFPMELPRRIIAGWSPSGVCTACGQGRRPVAVADGQSYYTAAGKTGRDVVPLEQKSHGAGGNTRTANGTVPSFPPRTRTITGYACACPDATAPARPAIVLDPFGGTGTTALVAAMLGRTGVSVDRSADYCRLAQWRVSDPGERARALQVPKPPPVTDGQASLFDDASLGSLYLP